MIHIARGIKNGGGDKDKHIYIYIWVKITVRMSSIWNMTLGRLKIWEIENFENQKLGEVENWKIENFETRKSANVNLKFGRMKSLKLGNSEK